MFSKSASSGSASFLSPAFPEKAAWGTAGKLRVWQSEALEKYFTLNSKDFLAVATPGAGKTTFALRVATELLALGVVQKITVVAPTEHLKHQWADAAALVGIALDPNFKNSTGKYGNQYLGVALTYAQVASKPLLHRSKTEFAKTLVILDEIHHGGDALSWGDAILEAFDPAVRRLALTGTPFRSDSATIPFVRYRQTKDGVKISEADYTYGYGDALRDSVVRPVIFLAYAGSMRWRTNAGAEMSAEIGDVNATKDVIAGAWRSALNPEGVWIPAVLAAADKRLTQVRSGMSDAGGLVIATDHQHARCYAQELYRITGQEPVVVLSDDKKASEQIDNFANSSKRWMVAVRMVSEGVDIPRLGVGVYATSTSTALFFAQVVGRFVRARRRGETASIFLPSVPVLLNLANQLEVERDHIIDKSSFSGDVFVADELESHSVGKTVLEKKSSKVVSEVLFEVLESSVEFDRVLFDGGEFGAKSVASSVAEEDFLGIPGLLDADQVGQLLLQRQGRHVSSSPVVDTEVSVSDHRQIKKVRKELSGLVSAWSRRSGKPHAWVHNELRNLCGGPVVSQASLVQLQERVVRVRGWFVGRK